MGTICAKTGTRPGSMSPEGLMSARPEGLALSYRTEQEEHIQPSVRASERGMFEKMDEEYLIAEELPSFGPNEQTIALMLEERQSTPKLFFSKKSVLTGPAKAGQDKHIENCFDSTLKVSRGLDLQVDGGSLKLDWSYVGGCLVNAGRMGADCQAFFYPGERERGTVATG